MKEERVILATVSKERILCSTIIIQPVGKLLGEK
jgi:hypothetical protein